MGTSGRLGRWIRSQRSARPRAASSPPWTRAATVLLAWHALGTALALWIGVVEGDFSLAVALLAWSGVAVVSYRLALGPYLLVGGLLALVEETLVYALGGGLQGRATSLAHDLAVAMPAFAAFLLGWYLLRRRYAVAPAAVFVLAGAHGLLLEIVLMGHADPAAVLLLGGPAAFIYGTIAVCPAAPPSEGRPAGAGVLALGWLGVVGLLAIAGVVGSWLVLLVV